MSVLADSAIFLDPKTVGLPFKMGPGLCNLGQTIKSEDTVVWGLNELPDGFINSTRMEGFIDQLIQLKHEGVH